NRLTAHLRAARSLGAEVAFPGALPPDATAAIVARAALAVLVPRVDADGTGAEGLGLALIEAAARGVPTVGCATGGVPEAVGPGLIVDDPDDPAASVAAIAASGIEGRGAAQWAWCAATHGTGRAVDALLAG
ncbi:MAG: glycosyltransferase, partial [Myxococcota bacterium]